MAKELISRKIWQVIIAFCIILISVLHYTTPTMKWQYHLILMQSYFIPILLAAFQFGVRGGLGSAIMISFLYLPHVMLQWGGLIESNLMRFLQILLFNIIGYLTGLKAQQEKNEKIRYQEVAEQLKISLEKQKEQSEKIEEMEDQLRQADRLAVIGELTASLAHEVRNPLGSIRGTVDILKNEISSSTQVNEFFSILVEETSRLNQVVENYLGFAGKRRKIPVRFDIRETIRNSKLLLSNKAKKNDVTIEILLPKYPLFIEGNPGELQQVLINLMLNSIQALPRGGQIKIRAEKCASKEEEDNITAGNSKNFCIELSDNGTGIAEKDLEKIFQPFYTTREEGTGLGLAIVKRIADQNRWEIKVNSQKNSGTKFLLFLPEVVTN